MNQDSEQSSGRGGSEKGCDGIASLRLEIFARLFGMAAAFHVVGNWAQPDLPHAVGLLNLATGLTGIGLAQFPKRSLLLGTAGLVVASALWEMPITGNHWVLAALVSAAIIVSGAKALRLAPAARLILVVFYGFAAFAKLNSAFLEPATSCAVFYADQFLESWGIARVDDQSPFSVVAIWTTLIVELSVPLLLLWRRARWFGVLLGTSFHTLISFDLGQHFYDFTSVLLPLFFLFLPDMSVERIAAAFGRISPIDRRISASVLAWVGVGLVVLASLPVTAMSEALLSRLPFIVWVPMSLCWLWLLLSARAQPTALSWRPGVAAGVIVGVAILNGLTPYTEVKTAYGFNMYSNLLTARGDSNHLLVTGTLPIRKYGAVEILASSDPGLADYIGSGYLVPMPNLRRYLSTRPETRLAYRVDNKTVVTVRAGDEPLLIDPGPWWWRFLPIRAIDVRMPTRCQDTFLAAL